MRNKKKKQWIILIVPILLLVILAITVINTKYVLLDNAQLMGSHIAARYAVEEETYVVKFETILNTLEIGLRKENRASDLNKWMKEYSNYVQEMIEIENLEIYASIDGKIAAATYWEGDEYLQTSETVWYKNAMNANGEIAYTDIYTDIRLKKDVFTISKQIKDTDDVVAIDIYVDALTAWRITEGLPHGGNYYLSDSQGNIIYSSLDTSYSSEKIEKAFSHIFAEIHQGVHDDSNSFSYGMDDKKRGVYYYEMYNGWYSVITIPYNTLLSETSTIWGPLLVLVVVAFMIAAVFIVLNYRMEKKQHLYNQIVRVLGDSYSSLYLVDLNKNSYERMKDTDYIKDKLSDRGSYEELQKALCSVMEPETYIEFVEAFSIENLKRLMKERVRDFGGDFKRLFGDEYRWVRVEMLYDESLQQDKIVLSFKDVHEEKAGELARIELLKNSLESVSRMAEVRTKFFSHISHDMRTPLNGIINLTKLAGRTLDNKEKIRDMLDKIRYSGEQLLTLINDILEISKMEQGKIELNYQEFVLSDRLKEMAGYYQLQANAAKKTFRTEFHINEMVVYSDWKRIQQILNNLLSNAFKYTGENGEIKFQVMQAEEDIGRYRQFIFIVSDNGVGMSKEFLKKVFLPFERDTKFGAANVSGTGLGMAIVHELIVHMDGQIRIDSEIGKGTQIEVILPLQVKQRKESGISDKQMNNEKFEMEEQVLQIDGNNLEGIHALIVEDNEINMEIATEILQMNGMRVTQAWNGAEAVEIFRNSQDKEFDIILMDMQMPVMDGCEAARQIRAMHRKDAATIPIIAVTANAFSEDLTETQKAGMNAHISKPFDFQILEKTIVELLSENRS